MGQRLMVVALVPMLASCARPSAFAQERGLGEQSTRVLESLQRRLGLTPEGVVRQSLGPPVDDETRARVLASLPADGEAHAPAAQRSKLVTAERMVDYTARRPLVFKIIDVDQAFVGLYRRAVVFVSARALALLDDEELTALVAHELGHDGHAAVYEQALARRDDSTMRELELEADGFAVLALRRAGIGPERLVSAIRKVTRYNDALFGPARGEPAQARYVSLDERIAFIRAVAAMQWSVDSPPSWDAAFLEGCG